MSSKRPRLGRDGHASSLAVILLKGAEWSKLAAFRRGRARRVNFREIQLRIYPARPSFFLGLLRITWLGQDERIRRGR